MVTTAAAPRRWYRTIGGRLPAAAQVLPRGARLRCRQAAVLAPVERRLDQRQDQDQQRDGGDDDEAGVRDHLVVGLAPQALAAVVALGGQCDGCREREHEGGQHDGPQHEPEDTLETPMAVLIASDLAKDMAGEPLLRGVSFRLQRRDRLTLSGRNGTGKMTLLRML